jgi:outer membrane lipoprotein SlyB
VKSLFLAISLSAAILLTGCANRPTHTPQSVGQISKIYYGKVLHVRNAVIGDDGLGTVGGAIIGGLAGSAIGKGRGNTLAIVGGALAGGAAGSNLNQSSGQELTILLENGDEISTVVSNKTSGISFRPGDLVALRIQNGKVTHIDLR